MLRIPRLETILESMCQVQGPRTDIDSRIEWPQQGAIGQAAFQMLRRRERICLAVCVWTEGSAGHCN